ncbi:MAG: oligosaccharide flippase family protein [Candidatus Woesebacteria bacterium]|nr:oligosaccharide flippase family protein [Candidatus Woesebacteria bacterium]
MKTLNLKKIFLRIFKHPLFSGGLIMVGGNMMVNVVNYIYHLVMGRVLGPVDYGILASVYSILYLVSIIPSSASVAIVKFISSAKGDKEVYSTYKSMSKLIFNIALICSIIILLFSPLIATFLHISNFWIVALTSPVLFFS